MANPVRRVGLIGKSGSAEALATARELADVMLGLGIELRTEDELAKKLGRSAADAAAIRATDLCVVVGGDGTFLRAVSLLGASQVPILGVNAGRLGFLTEIPRGKAQAFLKRALSGDFTTEPRAKLRAELWRAEERLLEEEVVNDVVLNRGALTRMVELRTVIDGAHVCRFRSDGLIVATPTGSTAYNLAAMGPILMPGLDGIVVSPICPHTLSQRPLVLSGDARVSIEVCVAHGELLLSLDGQASLALQDGDRVELGRGSSQVLLVRNPELDFFGILREKLHWNETA